MTWTSCRSCRSSARLTSVSVSASDVDELSELSELGSESSLDDWPAGGSLSPGPAHQDVTARLKAARDADRDRYLTAARLTNSPRSGEGCSLVVASVEWIFTSYEILITHKYF